jgi:hypothetical protein
MVVVSAFSLISENFSLSQELQSVKAIPPHTKVTLSLVRADRDPIIYRDVYLQTPAITGYARAHIASYPPQLGVGWYDVFIRWTVC